MQAWQFFGTLKSEFLPEKSQLGVEQEKYNITTGAFEESTSLAA